MSAAAAGTTAAGGRVPPTRQGGGSVHQAGFRQTLGRSRFWLALLALAAVAAALLVLTDSEDGETYGLGNTDLDGYAALASVLEDQGVTIHRAGTAEQALELSEQHPGAGVVVLTRGWQGGGEHLEDLKASEAELLWLSDSALSLQTALGDDVVQAGPPILEGMAGTAEVLEAGSACRHPAAQAAESVQTPGETLIADSGCFPLPGAADSSGEAAYALAETEHGWAFSAAGAFTNRHITSEGNAALALQLLGTDEHLIWYTPSPEETAEAEDWESPLDHAPGWVIPMFWWLVLCAVLAIIASARRDGPVVREPLAVSVPAAEAAAGRGRLYQRAGAYQEAAAGMRAAHLLRAAQLLGLGRSAPARTVAEAAARQTGRPMGEIAGLLDAGAPSSPSSSQGLVAYAQALAELEDQLRSAAGLPQKYRDRTSTEEN